MSEQPAYGTERIVLLGADHVNASHCIIRREVFTEGGVGHFYDDEANDFVTWTGRWTLVETLGTFDSRDAATAFMRARGDAA